MAAQQAQVWATGKMRWDVGGGRHGRSHDVRCECVLELDYTRKRCRPLCIGRIDRLPSRKTCIVNATSHSTLSHIHTDTYTHSIITVKYIKTVV